MFVFGVNQGMQPIAGYNYGAQKLDRLMRVLNLSIIAATAIMVTGWLIAMFLPYYCARMFTTDKHLIDLGIKAIRVVMFLLPDHRVSRWLSPTSSSASEGEDQHLPLLVRQLLILLPLLGFLPMIWDIDEGVWYSMPISDFSTASHRCHRNVMVHEQAEKNATQEKLSKVKSLIVLKQCHNSSCYKLN